MDPTEREKLSHHQYLSHYNVLVYLEDAVSQLLEYRHADPKVDVKRFFREYFQSVKQGTHVYYRDFRFVSSTPYNRSCFISSFFKCFRHLARRQDALSLREYHALICTLCRDFPMDVVKRCRLESATDGSPDSYMVTFPDFLPMLQFHLYYNEFATTLRRIFDQHSAVDPNSPPSSASSSTSTSTMDPRRLSDALSAGASRESFQFPPWPILQSCLSRSDVVSLPGFMQSLSLSQELNSHIGVLPPRHELASLIQDEHTPPPNYDVYVQPRPTAD